jgi:hypothetical protein
MEKWSTFPFGPVIYVRRGRLRAKHMGLKGGAVGNTLAEHIGNMKGTWWEQRKKGKSPLPTQNLKEKNQGTLSAC